MKTFINKDFGHFKNASVAKGGCVEELKVVVKTSILLSPPQWHALSFP